jgi:hypothetical protein
LRDSGFLAMEYSLNVGFILFMSYFLVRSIFLSQSHPKKGEENLGDHTEAWDRRTCVMIVLFVVLRFALYARNWTSVAMLILEAISFFLLAIAEKYRFRLRQSGSAVYSSVCLCSFIFALQNLLELSFSCVGFIKACLLHAWISFVISTTLFLSSSLLLRITSMWWGEYNKELYADEEEVLIFETTAERRENSVAVENAPVDNMMLKLVCIVFGGLTMTKLILYIMYSFKGKQVDENLSLGYFCADLIYYVSFIFFTILLLLRAKKVHPSPWYPIGFRKIVILFGLLLICETLVNFKGGWRTSVLLPCEAVSMILNIILNLYAHELMLLPPAAAKAVLLCSVSFAITLLITNIIGTTGMMFSCPDPTAHIAWPNFVFIFEIALSDAYAEHVVEVWISAYRNRGKPAEYGSIYGSGKSRADRERALGSL